LLTSTIHVEDPTPIPAAPRSEETMVMRSPEPMVVADKGELSTSCSCAYAIVVNMTPVVIKNPIKNHNVSHMTMHVTANPVMS